MVSFSTIKMAAKNLKMAGKGFEKVPLRDVRGVLDETNNFKWVKNIDEFFTETVYPKTGTLVVRSKKDVLGTGIPKSKFVTQASKDGSGSIIRTSSSYWNNGGNPRLDIYKYSMKNGKMIDKFLEKEFLPQRIKDAINAKKAAEAKAAAEKLTNERLSFIEGFKNLFTRKTVKGEDGTVTKFISRKSDGQTVSWWRKNANGEVMTGRVARTDLLGAKTKRIKITTPDKIAYKESVKTPIGKNGVSEETKKVVVDRANLANDPLAQVFMNQGLDLKLMTNGLF